MTRVVKKFDRNLYCKRNTLGKVLVMKKSKRFHSYLMEGYSLSVAMPADVCVMALTHNWSTKGVSVPWGECALEERMREIDRSNKSDLFEEMKKQHEKIDRSKKRDLANATEAFVSDSRREIMSSFQDVNTANMDKSKDIRRKYDKRLKE